MSATPASLPAALLGAFLTELRATFSDREPRGLYQPIDYILDLGGKRVRPLLALLAGRMYGDEDLRQAMPVALAVEVFHNFTLVHDDIMDDSPLRRGQATVHEKWDVNTGILSGDLMLIQAYAHLCRCPNAAALPGLLAAFNRVATGVCEGQQLDVDFETRSDVTVGEYLSMIERKTAVLLGGALEMGALAAGAGSVDAQHLYAFGRLTGLAFQLQDDLLDTFGDSQVTGKRTGNDIIRNKKTFLYLQASAALPPAESAELAALFASSPADPGPKVERVTELMVLAGTPRAVAELRDAYQAEAVAHLTAAGGDPAVKEVLLQLAEDLLQREA
ncbi:polyprenyl synthetase family protein [Neolewinella lacunae]|uniref:Polyprenyl synthetase family protein n=1 Tax=Neolewinella lacunae TaxID=1517758 RepID=A0A923PGH8_9BACT|nr:polyprenyl synthetase family protein [Neolewinella lacunae]MBC6993647.1 polyprenyl synthetase family protein [Neolewinella lacunae]MDN3634725.1 polyprenyl synthetase family protein [Neolewinella lacunae]